MITQALQPYVCEMNGGLQTRCVNVLNNVSSGKLVKSALPCGPAAQRRDVEDGSRGENLRALYARERSDLSSFVEVEEEETSKTEEVWYDQLQLNSII